MRSGAEALDLREVRAFVAVVDAGSFLAAARRLSVSQPTVSLQVQRMEAQLGAPLLVRERSGCRPTPAGATFLPHARRLLDAGERARRALEGERLTLGASSNIGVYHLPDVLAGWGDSAAVDRIDLQVAPHAELLEALAAGRVDLALTEWWDGRSGYDAQPWHREPLVAIVPPGHALARARSVTLERLFAEPLIGGEGGTGTATLLREAFGARIAMPAVRHAFGSTEGVKRAVSAGLGVSLVLARSCRDEVAAGALHTLRVRDGPLVKTFHAVGIAGATGAGLAGALLARLASPRSGTARAGSQPALPEH